MKLFQTEIHTPIGKLTLVAKREGLVAIKWGTLAKTTHGTPKRGRPQALLEEAAAQLSEYFAGRRKVFNLPLCIAGTPFQKRVWRALIRIPFGQTSSYGKVAWHMSNSKAARAVGNAAKRNPLPIIVPCHRVIGADGKLTGFAGGLRMKKWLLNLERAGGLS